MFMLPNHTHKKPKPVIFKQKVNYLMSLETLSDRTYKNIYPLLYAVLVNPYILSHSESKKANNFHLFEQSMK